jgi:predicted alpha/beta superfamily hydrolase
MLDANTCFGTTAETAKYLTKKPHGYDSAIVVGIGYPDGVEANKERFWDYTTPADPERLPVRGDRSPWPPVGGAEEFIHFIEAELKPVIEKRFTIDKTRQALCGHSLGGFFVLHVLFTRREAFSTYVAGSPSIWWNDNVLLEEEKTFRQELEQEGREGEAHRNITLFIAAGGLERGNPSRMFENAIEMAERLGDLKERGLTVIGKDFEGEGHVSVIPSLIARGIRVALTSSEDERGRNI